MISLIIPCYNEDEVLDALWSRVTDAAQSWGEDYEVVLVDDGSEEVTWRHVERLCRRDRHWRAIRFSRNFGHQAAVSAGLAHVRGDVVAVLDADLQDPPEELHRFLAKWREGYDVVYAVRRKRKEGPFKRLSYHLFYRLLNCLSSTPIPLDSGDFCLMSRKVVDEINALPEQSRFVRGLRAWVGFRQIGVEYERHSRAAGEPKYSFSKLVQLATNGLLSFSTAPLRLATWMGFVVSSIAIMGTVFTFLQRIFVDWFAAIGLKPVPGFATIVISILFIGGVQLVCLGVIGEYIGRIYDEVKHRPRWIVRETIGADDAVQFAQCMLPAAAA